MVHFKALYLQRRFLYYTRAYKSGLIESEIIVEISQSVHLITSIKQSPLLFTSLSTWEGSLRMRLPVVVVTQCFYTIVDLVYTVKINRLI